MAYDAFVDASQLNSDLTSIANVIRSKGGTTATLAFPSAFISAVNAIEDPTSYIDGTITSIQGASLSSIYDYGFAYCSFLSTVSFPICSTIGTYAFFSCFSLTTASFPKCTAIVGTYAFGYCFNLVSLYLMGSSVVTLDNSVAFVFYSSPIGGYSTSAGRYGSVFVPASLLSAYETAPNWSVISSRIVGI